MASDPLMSARRLVFYLSTFIFLSSFSILLYLSATHLVLFFFFLIIRPPPSSPPFPYPPLFRSLSTPASSQAPSRSFIHRCRVLRRTEALPGKGRLVAVLTPYSIVGARRIEYGVNTATKRSEEQTSELQSLAYLVCRLLLEKKKT